MASPPRTPEREEERRLNMRTLVIASAASASAAAVTSQLWIAGTWLAAAITPVMVALVSEVLHRPTEKIARAWTSDRPREALSRRPVDAPPAPRSPSERTAGEGPPVRIYRQPSAAPPRRGKIAIGVVAATAALAFGIAVVTITVGELIAGESIGKGDRRTTFVPGKSNKADKTRRPRAPRHDHPRPDRDRDHARGEQPTEPVNQPTTDTSAEPAPLPPPRTPHRDHACALADTCDHHGDGAPTPSRSGATSRPTTRAAWSRRSC